MIWGYARKSRPTQNIERQIRNIKAAYPEAIIVQEAYTGTTMSRPEWNKLEKRLGAGDMVVFDSVSRMSRTAQGGGRADEDHPLAVQGGGQGRGGGAVVHPAETQPLPASFAGPLAALLQGVEDVLLGLIAEDAVHLGHRLQGGKGGGVPLRCIGSCRGEVDRGHPPPKQEGTGG